MIDTTAPAKKNQNRFRAVTKKIDREKIGLKGSVFAHVEFEEHKCACGEKSSHARAVRFSFKKKEDDSHFDHIANAMGDAATEAIQAGPFNDGDGQ